MLALAVSICCSILASCGCKCECECCSDNASGKDKSETDDKIVAGRLDVDLELLGEDNATWSSIGWSSSPIFNCNEWEPGFVDVKVLRVENEGTLALKWKAILGSDATLDNMADIIDVYVSTTVSAYPQDRAEIESWKKVEFSKLYSILLSGELEAGKDSIFAVAIKVKETPDVVHNNYGGCCCIDITVLATQKASENDSFGNDYDSSSK